MSFVIFVTFSFYSEVSSCNLFFFEYFHGIDCVGILLTYHEDFSESASPDNFDKMKIIFGYSYSWIQDIMNLFLGILTCHIFAEYFLPIHLAPSTFYQLII